jgi:hypothetical protein
MKKQEGLGPDGLSTMSRIYHRLRVEGFDETFSALCTGCELQESCHNNARCCRAYRVVASLAVQATNNGEYSHIYARAFLNELRQAIEYVNKTDKEVRDAAEAPAGP